MGMNSFGTGRVGQRLRDMLWPSRTCEAPSPELRRTLIVGAGSGGQYIAESLRDHPDWKLWPVAFVDDNREKSGLRIRQLPVLGDTAAIPTVVDRERIEMIVIAIPSATPAKRDEIARIAKSTAADVVTMPSIAAILSGEQRVDTLHRVRMNDVLGRPMVEPDLARCEAFIRDRAVLITGAAGSIGGELALQVSRLHPSHLILFDSNESGLFDLEQELRLISPSIVTTPVVGSVTHALRMNNVFKAFAPAIVFHAAAYKHVPLMEQYPGEAVRTNVIGTRNVADAAARYGAERFVMVSTDKAVRPSNVMGATKRLAEVVVADVARQSKLSACSVRFGNVLGSRGSVIPTFERQIRAGGPVTVTHRDMRRYFMTIEEAAGLVIQSGAFGHQNAICILDMGEDVSIVELAERVIRLHGLRPHIDIRIEISGIRPGEKLREELSHDFEMARESPHPKIRTLYGGSGGSAIPDLDAQLQQLDQMARAGQAEGARDLLHRLVRTIDAYEEQLTSGAAATA